MLTRNTQPGSLVRASAWMVGLSAVLFWLPIIGPLIAGFVGGKKAGAVFPAMVAVLLPGLIFGVLSFFLGGLLSAIPLIGALFGLGGLLVSLMQIGPLLIGAIIGGTVA